MPRTPINQRNSRNAVASASSATAARKRAIDLMPQQLAAMFSKIESSINDLRASNLKYYHRLGQHCLQIKANPNKYVGSDGTAGMKLIEQALSTQARTLRRAAQFAEMYTVEQLTTLIGLRNEKSGFQLNWGHVVFLLTLDTPERRTAYAAEAAEKMLDPSALSELIQKRFNRKQGHGRNHKLPATLAAQVRQIVTVSKQWTGKNTDVWNGTDVSVFGNLMEADGTQVDQELVDQLTTVELLMQEIATAATENLAKATAAREYVRKQIEIREAAEAAHDSTSDQDMRALRVTAPVAETAPHSPRRRRTGDTTAPVGAGT